VRNLLIGRELGRPRALAPTDLSDDEHVRVVPAAGTGELLMAGLRKTNSRHARPGVADVAGHAPEIATDFGAPLPDFAVAVLAHAEPELAIESVKHATHQNVWLLIVLELVSAAGVRAPVVLEIVEAPPGPRAGVLLFVTESCSQSLTRGG